MRLHRVPGVAEMRSNVSFATGDIRIQVLLPLTTILPRTSFARCVDEDIVLSLESPNFTVLF
jgi:hypothetical protein